MQTSSSVRIRSIDYVRGLIMVIMAIDHVRDYFHITAQTADPLDLSTTTTGLFFTRWITHFCAPGFVFLSGMSAWFSLTKGDRNTDIVSSKTTFLIKRGAFIALFDVLLMSLVTTFNYQYNFVMITTLWAIGCSMIILGTLIKVAPKLILPVGLILFLGHDAMTTWLFSDPKNGNGLLRILFTGLYFQPVDSTHILAFLYSILPWTGVMLLGYSCAPLLQKGKKILWLGVAALILFIGLRFVNMYGDRPWVHMADAWKNFLAFINTTKYPPSLQFQCMTLGVICILLVLFKNSDNAFTRFCSVYGRVPFFYFVAHFFLAHLILVIAFYATGHTNDQIIDTNSPIWFRPQQFGFSLPAMYGIWAFVVLILYYPCKWFYSVKQRNKESWLRYV